MTCNRDSLKPLRQQIRSELTKRVLARCPVTRCSAMDAEAQAIALRWLTEGGTLAALATEMKLPRVTIDQWLRTHCPDEYAEAKQQGYDAMADMLLEIASTPIEMVETVETTDARGGVTTTVKRGDSAFARQLVVKTGMSMLERLAPDKYGTRTTVDVNVSMAQQIAAARSRVMHRDIEATDAAIVAPKAIEGSKDLF